MKQSGVELSPEHLQGAGSVLPAKRKLFFHWSLLSPYVLEERGTSVRELFSVLRECGYTVVDLKRTSAIIDSAGRL